MLIKLSIHVENELFEASKALIDFLCLISDAYLNLHIIFLSLLDHALVNSLYTDINLLSCFLIFLGLFLNA